MKINLKDIKLKSIKTVYLVLILPIFFVIIEVFRKITIGSANITSKLCIGSVLTSVVLCLIINSVTHSKKNVIFTSFALMQAYTIILVSTAADNDFFKFLFISAECVSLILFLSNMRTIMPLNKDTGLLLVLINLIFSLLGTKYFSFFVYTKPLMLLAAMLVYIIVSQKSVALGRKYNLKVSVMLLLYMNVLITGKAMFNVDETFLLTDLYCVNIMLCSLVWSCMLIFNVVDKFYIESEKSKLELTIKEKETALMLSQIKPHFIYNTLNTIQYLARTEPEMAAETISDFSDYLRTNLNASKRPDIVSFEEELEHVKKYLKIEKLRFGNRLKVYYNIKCTDFYVPILSIEPIVENSVKHGISKRVNGGTITISTFEEKDNYIIEVKDNGIGFNKKGSSEGNNLGMNNVRLRVKNLLGGNVSIESKFNIGTVVRLSIPKDSAEGGGIYEGNLH